VGGHQYLPRSFVEEHMAKMVDLQIWNDIEVQKTREKVWTMKDEQGGIKGEWMYSD